MAQRVRAPSPRHNHLPFQRGGKPQSKACVCVYIRVHICVLEGIWVPEFPLFLRPLGLTRLKRSPVAPGNHTHSVIFISSLFIFFRLRAEYKVTAKALEKGPGGWVGTTEVGGARARLEGTGRCCLTVSKSVCALHRSCLHGRRKRGQGVPRVGRA